MKKSVFTGILIILMVLEGFVASGQNCNKFHLYGSCMQYPGAYYKMDGQSRSNIIGVGDKLVYNVVFYGERTYKLIFCATDLFNPVHFTLLDSETRELIYDNKKDDYPETIELSIENTRRIMIEVSVLALNADNTLKEDFLGCSGFLLHWRPVKK